MLQPDAELARLQVKQCRGLLYSVLYTDCYYVRTDLLLYKQTMNVQSPA